MNPRKPKNQNPEPAEEKIRGLPSHIESEKLVLGSILLRGERYLEVAGQIQPDDFSLEDHRRIFHRMADLAERNEAIDHGTVAYELQKHGEMHGSMLSYLLELQEGVPQLPSIDAYVGRVKETAVLRRVIFSSQHLINRVLAGGETAEEILSGARQTLDEIEDGRGRGDREPTLAGKIIEQVDGGISAFLDPSKRSRGLTTGFNKLDDMTNGLHCGDLFILAARPSAGKTALASNVVENIAIKKRRPCAIFSLEMTREAVLARMLCSVARVDSQRFRSGYLSQEERRKLNVALQQICESPIYIDDTTGLSLEKLHSKLRRFPVELAVVDYLQLMTAPKRENRNQEVSALSRGLKLIAKDCNLPLLVLSQLSRAVESRGDHRPMLSDLRESGGIEQDADVVGFVFREEMYHRDREDLRGLAELIIAKQRNGPIGTVNLVFLHGQTKFENRAEDTGEYVED